MDKYMKVLAIVALWVTAIEAAVGAQYLCIADMATGYKFDQQEERWKSVDFDVTGMRYILRPIKQEEFKKYEFWGVGEYTKSLLVQFGTDDMVAACSSLPGVGSSSMHCEAGGVIFRFSSESNRYVLTDIGWSAIHDSPLLSGKRMDYDGKPHVFTKPAVELGSCSPI